MTTSPEEQVEKKFVLREVTKKRKKPLWFRTMTAIGPCTTGDPRERAEYQTREHALAAPCWRHTLTCWEVEEVVPDAS